MRTRMIVMLLSALAVSVFSVGSVSSKRAAVSPVLPATDRPPFVASQETSQEPPGTISGAEHPELIPDHVAYSVLLRLVANRQTAEEKGRIDSYIRAMLGMGCKSCGPLREARGRLAVREAGRSSEQERADIAAVLAVAGELHREVTPLDARAKAIKEQRRGSALSPAARAELDSLQARKTAAVNAAAAALLGRLSPVSRGKLRSFVSEHLKRKIKMTPSEGAPQPWGVS